MMNDPAAVAAALTPLLGAREFEAFLVIPLDCRCRAIDVVEISRGDVDGCEAFPRKVVQAALAMGATSAIVAHNHPTGVSLPSAADAAVTRRLAQALRTLDCPLDDHLVIARGGAWTSLRQQQPHLFVG
jgi:DNA repair protein RadC